MCCSREIMPKWSTGHAKGCVCGGEGGGTFVANLYAPMHNLFSSYFFHSLSLLPCVHVFMKWYIMDLFIMLVLIAILWGIRCRWKTSFHSTTRKKRVGRWWTTPILKRNTPFVFEFVYRWQQSVKLANNNNQTLIEFSLYHTLSVPNYRLFWIFCYIDYAKYI